MLEVFWHRVCFMFILGMGTAAKSAQISHPIEEFLGHDDRGHAVVLRRNVEHPGEPIAPSPAKKSPAFSLHTKVPEESRGVAGGLGFFSDFQEVRNRLREKGLLAK